jgi:GNAT superfamily N-acetyltransferase
MTDIPYKISPATPDDYQPCLELLYKCVVAFYNPLMEKLNLFHGYTLPILTPQDFIPPAAANRLPPVGAQDTQIFVAHDLTFGNLLGCVLFERQPTSKPTLDTLFISRLNVLPEVRHHGIGIKLIAQALNFCETHSTITTLSAKILSNNHRMLRSFPLLGFEQSHTSENGAYIHVSAGLDTFRRKIQTLPMLRQQ